MERQDVNGHRIVSIGWEDDVLEVKFTTGAIYRYFKVDVAIYNELILTEFVDREFDRLVKKGGYPYIKVN